MAAVVIIAGCRKDDFKEVIGICPVVLFSSPAAGAVGVSPGEIITVTFNKKMNPVTINRASFTLLGTTPIEGTVSYTDSTASFTPFTPLPENTTFIGRVTTAVKDLTGNALQTDYAWTFSTGQTLSPIVISTSPANNATSVVTDKIITATFSVPMDALTINSTTFTVHQGTTLIAGSVFYNGTVASFTPSVKLSANTVYTASITTGAKNVAGNSLANDYVWSFSTQTNFGPAVVDLQSVARFGILAGVAVTNSGFSEIRNLDVGISPGVRSSITGFPPAILVNGEMYASDDVNSAGISVMLTQAKQDLAKAYLFAEGATFPAPVLISGDLGGRTLVPGIYKSTSTLLIQAGHLTLDAQGDANAVWIFQVASDLTTVGGAGGNIILSGGAQAKNIFWQTGSSAIIGDGTAFKGNILALTSVTMNAGSTIAGRILSRNGAIVLTSTNIIDKP